MATRKAPDGTPEKPDELRLKNAAGRSLIIGVISIPPDGEHTPTEAELNDPTTGPKYARMVELGVLVRV